MLSSKMHHLYGKHQILSSKIDHLHAALGLGARDLALLHGVLVIRSLGDMALGFMVAGPWFIDGYLMLVDGDVVVS